MTTPAVQLQYDVPLPSRRRSPSGAMDFLRALAAAPIGASFTTKTKDHTLRGLAHRLGGGGWISVRKDGDGIRVWKVAEPKAVS